jgi:O-antigen/teichoic acid export membrane protein
LKTFFRSPALWSAIVFASGGVGFAVGSILLARVLPEEEFGRVALFLALTQLGITLGPLGVETVINRHHLGASAPLLTRVGLTSALVGVAFATIAFLFYEFDVTLACVLAFTVIAAAINRVGGSFFQSKHQFGLSLFLILIHNWVVLFAVPVVLLFGPHALPAALTVASGYVLIATLGWQKGFGMRDASARSEPITSSVILREGFAVVGVQLAVAAFYQIDRLVIGQALTLRDLAVFSVVSSVAASPYRMLQTGLAFTLLPRLRSAESRSAILKLLRHEMIVAVAMSVAASVVVLAFTPWLLSVLLDSRYAFPSGLLYALVIVGFVRVWNGLSSATVSALATPRQLFAFNACIWAALAVGTACAWSMRAYGLQGIVYGLGVGWLASALGGTLIGAQAVARRGIAAGEGAVAFGSSGATAPRSSMN